MEHEAISAGYYDSPHIGAFPKIQILTIEGLNSGPGRPAAAASFKKAKVEEKQGVQPGLGFDNPDHGLKSNSSTEKTWTQGTF